MQAFPVLVDGSRANPKNPADVLAAIPLAQQTQHADFRFAQPGCCQVELLDAGRFGCKGEIRQGCNRKNVCLAPDTTAIPPCCIDSDPESRRYDLVAEPKAQQAQDFFLSRRKRRTRVHSRLY